MPGSAQKLFQSAMGAVLLGTGLAVIAFFCGFWLIGADSPPPGLSSLIGVLTGGPEGWLWNHLSSSEPPMVFILISCWMNCVVLSWVLIIGCQKLFKKACEG
jgi:hypothetical protein